MRTHLLHSCVGLFSTLILAVPLAAQSQQDVRSRSEPRELCGYLPENTPLVVDLVNVAACLARLEAFLEPLPKELPAEIRAALEGYPALVRAKTGRSLDDLLETLAPGQLCFAMFPPENGKPFPLLLSRVADPADARPVLRKMKNVPWHLQGSVLTISDSRKNLLRALRFRESDRGSLLTRQGYVENRVALRSGKSVRVYVDLKFLKNLRNNKKSFFDELGVGGRLLIGPAARALDSATRFDVRLDLETDILRLTGSSDASVIGNPNDLVGKLLKFGDKRRRLPPAPRGTLASLSMDRDLAVFFKRADDLLKEDDAANVRSFLSMADLFVKRTTFVDGIINAMAQPATVFVSETEPEDADQEPRIKLPAFSLVVPLLEKNRRRFQTTMKNALRLATTIAIAERTQQKIQPTLRLRSQRRGEYHYQYIEYGEWPGPGEPPTEVGIGVTMLFAHDHAILATTRDGAVRAAEALKSGEGKEVCGDYVSVRGAMLARYAARNMGILALDRVLKEGDSLSQAKKFYQGLCAVMKQLELDASLAPSRKATNVKIELRRIR